MTTPLTILDDDRGGSNDVVGRLVTTNVGTEITVVRAVVPHVLREPCTALMMPIISFMESLITAWRRYWWKLWYGNGE